MFFTGLVEEAKVKNPTKIVPHRYSKDYLCALIIHAMMWSISIMIPSIIFGLFTPWIIAMVLGNTIIHAIVDDLKANKFKLNLIQDQIIHFAQIIITWIFIIMIF